VIRHGEKKSVHGCLNDRGQARAENLVNVFSGHPLPAVNNETFFKPAAIFANWYLDTDDCERCNQTVTPLAEALGLPIDLTHGGDHPGGGSGPGGGDAGAALAIKAALKSTGGPVVVAWEHMNIQFLTAALGVAKDKIPHWPGEDFDTLYVFEFDTETTLLTFRVSKEGFEEMTAAEIVV
jgi:hypothetical protein